ncbi:hypothetical protein Tc00.1047053506409.60 [Trypanosoma cruzi]|uniref:Uncharacterized protein n=1 Tax=Trypanosoma cruzi (strain CL Brener) TaxID=353153 RepID=Q4DV31_TRYCC|nr:hypothetical protein Tc00.1047053506409.60 [Trypanosoma cruzi]EAN96375.1 hypothetical protein Tc00.1047053506409.60 [Trypanosoma cruzi]|eukprot:XP_818226.1 hypothetical protein [Trypanosoma cruzi strain CL Brener]
MRGKCTATERHPALSLQGNVHPQNIWTRHHQTVMPFHAPINRSEDAFWCVGVHSHIFISTAINGEESGATATKRRNKNVYCSTLPAKSRNNTNRIIGCTNTRKKCTRRKKRNCVPCSNPNTRSRHEDLSSGKTKQSEQNNMCGHLPTSKEKHK